MVSLLLEGEFNAPSCERLVLGKVALSRSSLSTLLAEIDFLLSVAASWPLNLSIDCWRVSRFYLYDELVVCRYMVLTELVCLRLESLN